MVGVAERGGVATVGASSRSAVAEAVMRQSRTLGGPAAEAPAAILG
jgi:hypothetical protein